MILLLGGTSESVETARLLVDHGLKFVFSMATEMPIGIPDSRLLTLVRSAMDNTAMEKMIHERMITAVVDATHPYAVEVTRNAILACRNSGVRYFRLSRRSSVSHNPEIIWAMDHMEAARKAGTAGRTVLSTIGVRNLGPYASVCYARGIRLIVRAMPSEESLNAIKSLGIPNECVITGKGPFTFEQNVEAIRRFEIGTLVTKDSGVRGGTDEKIRAAIQEKCIVIVVRRPEPQGGEVFFEPGELVKSLINYLGTISSKREGVTPITML
ncbi:MAG: precorrin-6A reductase [Pseudomonadota bacterium]